MLFQALQVCMQLIQVRPPKSCLIAILIITADFVANVLGLALNGLTTNDLQEVVGGEGPLENSGDNINPINPTPAVYPKKDKGDAPYSVAEKTLKSAIYIPSNFTYGKVPPVLLIPGTAGTSGANFAPNFGKLFTGSDYADPVYVNIPGNNLADIQVEAEFVAYAINYISGISNNKNVSLLSWSAGSVDGQWAMVRLIALHNCFLYIHVYMGAPEVEAVSREHKRIAFVLRLSS